MRLKLAVYMPAMYMPGHHLSINTEKLEGKKGRRMEKAERKGK